MGKLDRWFVSRKQYDADLSQKDVAIDRLFDERDDLDDDLQDALQRIAELNVAKHKVTKAEFDSLWAMKCAHCGGSHTIACPRVRRLRFRPDGQSPSEVEFFADGEWPKDSVVWLEDLVVEEPKPN